MATTAPARDTSSSGGKVFAKASKEWTIPPRPRPGRKAAETAPKTGKSAQNREAQRAFRERKQDYVAELEQRCRDYEQNEVQKNIALQSIALAHKAENENLRADNDRLRALVAQLGGDPNSTPGSSTSGGSARGASTAGRKKRKVKVEDDDGGSFGGDGASRAGSASRSGSILGEGPTYNDDGGRGVSLPATMYQQQDTRRPSSSSSSTTPVASSYLATTSFYSSNSSTMLAGPSQSTSPSSISPHSHSQPHSHPHPHPSTSRPPPPTSNPSGPSVSYASSFVPSCGFCTTNDTPCICRMAAESRDLHSGSSGLLNSSDVSPKATPGPSSGVDYPATHSSTSTGGGAVSLPSAYLRRRNSGSSHQPPAAIWSYTSLAASSASSAPTATSSAPTSGFVSNSTVLVSNPDSLPMCSGNPADCAACADDPFGKAFCETIEGQEEEETETTEQGHPHEGGVELSCCGVPGACGSIGSGSSGSSCVDGAGEDGAKKLVLGAGSSSRSSVAASSIAGSEEPEGADHHAMVPTSTAWRQFKSHPNATFADLSLLADICLARRAPTHTHAAPSHASTSVPPGIDQAPSSPFATVKVEEEEGSIGGSTFGGSVPPVSRKRRRAEVEVEGVREALRILDARGKRTPGGEVLVTGNSILSVAPGVVDVAAGKRERRMSDIRGTLDEFTNLNEDDGEGAAEDDGAELMRMLV